MYWYVAEFVFVQLFVVCIFLATIMASSFLSFSYVSAVRYLPFPFSPFHICVWISFDSGTRIDAKCSSPSVKTGSSCVAPTQGDETILHVDRILGRRWNSKLRRIEFLTVWSGFPDPSENSWEPETNFSLQSLAIFGRMWGKANDLPHDGTAEMLSDGEIRKMQVIQDGGTEADSAQIKSTRSGHSSETTPARSAIVWTPVNECILLLTALEHPEDLVAEGPGEFS